MSSPQTASRSPAPFIPAIDGIRALAVIAVILYHAEIAGLAAGGFLGVDVFFVVSGYLITRQLLGEHDLRGRIAVTDFYLRRVRRLIPAIVAMILVLGIISPLLAPGAAGRLWEDTPAGLLQVSNWWQLHSRQSYFEMSERLPLLRHLWTLALEWQFYLLWPVVLSLVLRRWGRACIPWIAAVGALASTAWMTWLVWSTGVPVETDPSRVYLGSDTHAMGLLVGAFIGSLRARAWVEDAAAGGWIRARRHDLLAAGALLLILAAFWWVREDSALLYRSGGFLAVAVVSALLVRTVSERPAHRMTRWLDARVLCWIGERSYGLYLWHWPVMLLLRPGHELPAGPYTALLIQIAVTTLIAEASYRYIETPLRRRPISAWTTPLPVSVFTAGVVMALTLNLMPAPFGLGGARSPELAQQAEATAAAEPAPASAAPAEVSTTPLVKPDGQGRLLTAIGDSVLLGARDTLMRHIPGVRVDAQVGRQGHEGLAKTRALRAAGELAPAVLVHLGTNGYLNEQQFSQLLAELSDRQLVILLNVHAKRRWSEPNNALLAKFAAQHPNVRMVDWARLGSQRPEYFVSDGIHLTGAGMRGLLDAVRSAIGLPEAPPVVARREPPPTQKAKPMVAMLGKPPVPRRPGMSTNLGATAVTPAFPARPTARMPQPPPQSPPQTARPDHAVPDYASQAEFTAIRSSESRAIPAEPALRPTEH